ncbi:hypothetical protein CH298_22995 [Rhodococcoides fascians]|uniref:AbiTii domain-containing protein n=1 Tax=Rhodococcoides fascians TaxID=1828 RepID=UPI000B9AE8D2|nr:hypothetical protein [Rhodococcus fascians]OZE85517.1 hypothetical protein CH303_23350 [Rhodococcus fascians]OZF12024.1 hypothetical protein CH298_22995 [Rhodococcus fascians]OZF14792.1 hypothetical protein CH297_23375 [Rhodococcus fascians]OZF61371.1 hypothetical protein CH308_22995 [Rhodococcus fascians]OZF64476.1 hypothetical protein CH307_23190 [Rhodococcus fascians]
MLTDRLAQALALSEQLLTDFEMSQISPVDIIRRASRLARLLNDTDASEWLAFEIRGFSDGKTEKGKVTVSAWAAAKRSGRVAYNEEGEERASLTSVSQLQANIESAKLQLSASADAPVSVSSANPTQYVTTPSGNTVERVGIRKSILHSEATLQAVLGTVHLYVTDRNYDLRFGSAVETSFTRLRSTVDEQISTVVPGATAKLAAAFELATSDNPAHWDDAASYCRKLVKDLADVLQPPSGKVDGRPMGDGQYINRLVYWIQQNEASSTTKDVLTSDLEFFGKRIDALTDAGHKGVHATVDQRDADRFIVGTYLLISDVLRLHAASTAPVAETAIESPDESPTILEELATLPASNTD